MDWWTMERIDQLMAMVVEGKSFAEIAEAMGTTRNSVSGKYHRIRIKRGHVPVPRKRVLDGFGSAPSLFDRDTVIKRQYNPTRALPGVPKDGVGFLLPAIPPPVPRTGAAVGILDVTGCKWPVAKDASVIGGHAFCNGPKHDGSPYCAHHRKVAKGVHAPVSWVTKVAA